MHEAVADTELVQVQGRAADEAAHDIAASGVARQGTIGNAEGDGAGMVGNATDEAILCFLWGIAPHP